MMAIKITLLFAFVEKGGVVFLHFMKCHCLDLQKKKIPFEEWKLHIKERSGRMDIYSGD